VSGGGGVGDGGAGLVLDPGAYAFLVVTPLEVPQVSVNPTTGGPSTFTDTVIITSTPSLSTAITVGLTEQASGAIFSFKPSGANFGQVPVSSTGTQPFAVQNAGNATADFQLVVTDADGGVGPFSVSAPGPTALAGTTNPASPTSSSVNALFAPVMADQTAETGQIALTTTSGVTCGPPLTPFTLSGQGVTGNVGISTTSIEFGPNLDGKVPCGTTATPQTVCLTNAGNASYNWTASLTSGSSYYTITPTTGTVLPGTTDTSCTTFTVTPKLIPVANELATDYYGGAVQISTTAPGDAAHQVQLHQTAEGAVLTDSLGSTYGFGPQTVGLTALDAFTVTNAGNLDATISFNVGAPFGVQQAFAGTVPANTTQSADLTFAPMLAQPYSGSVAIVTSTTLCAALPNATTLSGTGAAAVPPSVSLSTSSISFGPINCGASASATPPIDFTVQNKGTDPFTVTAQMQNSKSIFQPVLSGTVAGGSQTTGSIGLAAAGMPAVAPVTPDYFADVLEIVATSTKNNAITTTSIPVHITAQGAIVSFVPSALDFGIVPENTTSVLPFTVQNKGNLLAEVNLVLANTGKSSSVFTRTPTGLVEAAANANQSLSMSFAASDDVGQTGTLTMVATANPSNVFCSSLPAPMELTAQGSNNTFSVSPTSLIFGSDSPGGTGYTNCGNAATERQVMITNSASTTLTWTASFLSGSSYYSLSASSGSVNASGTGTFNVIPKAIPTTSPVTPNYYAAILQVSANGQAVPIQISQTAQGVILQTSGNGQPNFTSLAFGGVAVNQTATAQFSITNNGNAPLVGGTLTNTNTVFSVNPNWAESDAGTGSGPQSLPINLAPQQSLVPQVTFTPAAVTSYTDNAIYSLPPSTVLCAAAPPNF
jgi:hypothetical protein